MEFKNIKWKVGLPYVVRLLKNEPEEKKGKYGMFQEYTAEYEGEEYKFIASEGLHNSLLEYKKGDILEILKVEGDDNKTFFEVEQLTESDIKSTEQPKTDYESGPNWDRINADKQHSITLAIAMKLAVQSMPVKAKLTDENYEEIEVRMVKFSAIMEKYLGGVVMKGDSTPGKPTINVFVQKKADMFREFLKDNEDKLPKDIYDTSKKWIEDLDLEKADTKQLTVNLDKIKKQIIEPKTESGKYESYHEELITACCETLKTKDRLPIIQTLNNMVKGWNIEGTEKLSDASENECLNLLEQFDNQLKEEDSQNLPY